MEQAWIHTLRSDDRIGKPSGHHKTAFEEERHEERTAVAYSWIKCKQQRKTELDGVE